MNCLGIGPSQGSTNLVPNSLIVNNSKMNKINTEFINSINSLKKINKENNESIMINSNQTSDIRNETNMRNSNRYQYQRQQGQTQYPSQQQTQQHQYQQIQQQTHQNVNSQSNKLVDVNWSNIFLTICKKRLFNYFKDLKMLLNHHSYFKNKLVCYIDETNTKYLIQNYPNNNVATLRIQLNRLIENQINNPNEMNIKNSVDINKALDLVKNLELMGPSNNLLICLDIGQVKMLRNMFQDGNELYWPNGKEGITWLVHFNN